MDARTTDRWVPLPTAAAILGRTSDHVMGLVDDGTLAAVDTARPGAQRRRISVAFRLGRPRPADGKGLSLAEWMEERSL
ncbi:MAG: hypothetical protein IJU44_07405 [Kiritimatiellae bacterium]|nr:hypothetical protein [Kiritimatiellia bacterium]